MFSLISPPRGYALKVRGLHGVSGLEPTAKNLTFNSGYPRPSVSLLSSPSGIPH